MTKKTKYLYGIIDHQMLSELADFLSQDGEKTLYLSINGGDIGCAFTMIEMINDTKKLTVVGCNFLYSAGFYVYHMICCDKYLTSETRGMWHQGVFTIDVRTDGKVSNAGDKFNLKLHKEHNKIVSKVANDLKMSKKEIKTLKKGEEVYFTYSRMLDFFG